MKITRTYKLSKKTKKNPELITCARYLPYALAMDTLASTDTSGMIIIADRISYNISGSVTVVFPDVYPKGGNCIVGSPGLADSIWIKKKKLLLLFLYADMNGES